MTEEVSYVGAGPAELVLLQDRFMSKFPPVTRVNLPSGQLRPKRADDWLLRQLPVNMVSHDFFRRFVSIFQELGSTLLDDVDNVDHLIDVTVAPPEFVRWLATWIHSAPIDPSLPEELQRRMTSSAAKALAWRGTGQGLMEFLTLLSEGEVAVEDGGGIWRSGDAPADTNWVRLHVQSTGQLAVEEFVELVRDEIPAHVRAELWVAGTRVWASDEDWDAEGQEAHGSVPIPAEPTDETNEE